MSLAAVSCRAFRNECGGDASRRDYANAMIARGLRLRCLCFGYLNILLHLMHVLVWPNG